MNDHPIQGLMSTAMENIKSMIDVNTIVGEPVHTPSGDTILPISRVGVGFVAGGSEIRSEHDYENHTTLNNAELPFGGGSGGGVSITPIAFLVVGSQGVKVVPLDNQTHLLDRVIDSAPIMFDKIQSMLQSNQTNNMQNNTSSMTSGHSMESGSNITSSSDYTVQ